MKASVNAIAVVAQPNPNRSVRNPDSSGPANEPREYPEPNMPDTIANVFSVKSYPFNL